MKRIFILDSKNRTNIEETSGSEYKFKLNTKIKINGYVTLEKFIFQNSQYTFSEEKNSNKFIYTNSDNVSYNITIEGKFDNIDAFVKNFNDTMQTHNIKMIYTSYKYEIKIQHQQGSNFKLEDLPEGTFMSLIGYKKINQGQSLYTNDNVPLLFTQELIYISISELGTYEARTVGSNPFTFVVVSQPGFQIATNTNDNFENKFYAVKDIDEITVKIRDSNGQVFVNNKGNSNFIMILSY